MALLRVEAEKLSNNTLVSGIVEEIIERDPLFALLPFVKVNSKAYLYNRENVLAEGEFLDPYDVVPESASTFTEVVAKLKILAGDVDIDKFLDQTMSDTNDQTVTQLIAKAKGMGRKFSRTLVNGDEDTSPKEFNGIRKLVTGGQTIEAGVNGAALSFSMLDELLAAVPNGADAIFMRQGTLHALYALQRSLGGTSPDHIELPHLTGVRVPHYMGKPILVSDFLPGDETQGTSDETCSIYAARLNESDGLHGLYGGDSVGFSVENIGTVQNKDATRWRIKWYTGLALKSTKSLARVKGVLSV